MTEQEKLAREWADYAKNVAVSSPEQQAAADFILAHTAPPTMEDVEWDAREHRGLGTVDEDGTESVSYTHLTLPTIAAECRSRWSPYH